MNHVYWIGGASGGGKSTMARRLAAEHGLHLYDTDAVMTDHASRASAGETPFLSQFKAMDMDERWLNRSSETMLDTFHWYRGEGFDLIVDDLKALPPEPAVIAEGFRLLPHLVKPLLSGSCRAVWLLPTPDFRVAAFSSRGSLWKIAGQTSDPPRALNNLLERERMFTERVRQEATHLGLQVIEVDRDMTEDDLAALVSGALFSG